MDLDKYLEEYKGIESAEFESGRGWLSRFVDLARKRSNCFVIAATGIVGMTFVSWSRGDVATWAGTANSAVFVLGIIVLVTMVIRWDKGDYGQEENTDEGTSEHHAEQERKATYGKAA